MNTATLPILCAALTTALVATAMITDLRWRRIPNVLTFSGFGLALVVRTALEGWMGLGLALGGAVLAPLLLLAMHGGKGLGMGDLKLVAAVGAFLGPVLAVVTMLITALAGGVMALVLLTTRGGGLAQLFGVLLIGVPFAKKLRARTESSDRAPVSLTMPYGVAIAVGTLITVAVVSWTGNNAWSLSFAGIAGSL